MGQTRPLILRYTPIALKELAEILEYIRTQSPYGASKVSKRLHQLISLLPDFPYAGKMTSAPPLRILAATPYPYLVFYEIGDAEVVIIGFRHAARNPMSEEESFNGDAVSVFPPC
ncbi:type II toxin-antitoxin system RelE/ParE family toxin [Rhizobium lemnae]|uniref:Type II toxin-antitoxin system RelE/ParE family toxin n=1 Tax=Rhizobium lemnae TaxID=1214924 RepID=A0ABV8EAV8_9HYPH|nr:type II toxin-antitoxin system RelE/ParE family toxin [Rhizobium lemnae]MCJ8506821.1 type II toxin-antitoxin system RelE/ParE family toxin [Rhizobium lemnae]